VASNAAEDGAYASGVCGILLSPKDMTLMDGGSTALVHELLHIAWQRNGEYMGSVLCEGFAVYYAQQILKDDKALTSNYDTQEQMAGYDQLITEDNMEEVFTSTTSGYNRYKLGYCMTSYIIETYGIAAYRRVHNKVTGLKEGTDLMPLTTVATVLKSELSANFFKEFADWHNMNHKRFGDKDLTAAGE